MNGNPFPEEKFQMQIVRRGIRDERVLAAVRSVPRDRFVPKEMRGMAYEDVPLPIGWGQTVSQPYVVAYMLEAAQLKPTDKVLEIGTGCGYQTALLAKVVRQVYTVEVIEDLLNVAKRNLADLAITNVDYLHSNGREGWIDNAPYDAIIVAAGAENVPEPLMHQLADGGRLIIPVGQIVQYLLRIHRGQDGFVTEKLIPVLFVPLVDRELPREP